jgi:hypothetical protein
MDQTEEVSMHFDSTTLTSPAFLIGAVVVLILIVAAFAIAAHERKKKTEHLRSRFGPEYDLALTSEGNQRKAEAALLARAKRHQTLKIRELTAAERARYIAEWEIIQSRFVDQPRAAVAEADELVNSLLQVRGYPSATFDERASDISVEHARLVGPYRTAHEATLRAARNEATTEELRTAVINYRALFDELLQISSEARTPRKIVA